MCGLQFEIYLQWSDFPTGALNFLKRWSMSFDFALKSWLSVSTLEGTGNNFTCSAKVIWMWAITVVGLSVNIWLLDGLISRSLKLRLLFHHTLVNPAWCYLVLKFISDPFHSWEILIEGILLLQQFNVCRLLVCIGNGVTPWLVTTKNKSLCGTFIFLCIFGLPRIFKLRESCNPINLQCIHLEYKGKIDMCKKVVRLQWIYSWIVVTSCNRNATQ